MVEKEDEGEEETNSNVYMCIYFSKSRLKRIKDWRGRKWIENGTNFKGGRIGRKKKEEETN